MREKKSSWSGTRARLLSLMMVSASVANGDQPALPDHTQVPLPALAARYELRLGAHTTDWYLTRSATRIETFNAGSRQGEIWERSLTGAVDYRRVFFSDRKIVEYSAGELRARHAAPHWAKLASLVDPEEVARLRRTGASSVFGERALVLEGRIDGVPIRLRWLPEAQVPTRLERGAGEHLISLQLIELHPSAPADWPHLTDERLATFDLIDAADFGDRESDPFVQKVLAQDGRDRGHAHGQTHSTQRPPPPLR